MSKETMIIHVNAQIAWRAFRDQKTKYWVAICDALKLTAQGETWEKLNEIVNEIVQTLFLDLFEEGDLEQFLIDHGWTPDVPLRKLGKKPVHFDVPFSISRDAAMHAVA